MRTSAAQNLDVRVGRGREKLDVPFAFNGLGGAYVNNSLTSG